MKSKRISPIILILIIMTLVACTYKADSPKQLTKEGISPYELSESEKYILQSFGMEGNSQIISFHAPKKAISLNVNVYKLENGESWTNIGGGAISIGTEREPTEQLTGTFTMLLKENHAFDFNINSSGRASFKTEEIILDSESMASIIVFLQEFQRIEINKEIPVALMVYDSGRRMRSYSLQDYFTPSKFDGMDLVQVFTLTFSDKELSASSGYTNQTDESYYYSDLMENPIDQTYLSLVTDLSYSQIEYRNFQERYYEIWEEEYHKVLNVLKSKAAYQKDKEDIEQFDKSVESLFDNNNDFFVTAVLDDYKTDPTSPEKNSWGNGTRDKLLEIRGKIYRNACIQIITLLDEGEYTFPKEIDFFKETNEPD